LLGKAPSWSLGLALFFFFPVFFVAAFAATLKQNPPAQTRSGALAYLCPSPLLLRFWRSDRLFSFVLIRFSTIECPYSSGDGPFIPPSLLPPL